MNYNEAEKFLFNSIPNYQNKGKAALRPGLKNIKILSKHFKNPHYNFKSIHIGGTNGKGTTSTETANLCNSLGLKTGLFTSPHIYDFRERIQVNGNKIKKSFVTHFIKNNKKFFSRYDFSFFELTTIMAFEYFKYEKVELAIIEVGLGGRLDSTNIINPVISLVTNVGSDHQNILGDNIIDIAREKAGIIKTKTLFIKGERQENIDHVFLRECLKKKSTFVDASSEVFIKTISKNLTERKVKVLYKNEVFKIKLKNPTNYFLKNFHSAFLLYSYIKEHFDTNNLIATRGNSNFKIFGRWNVISRKPLIISDGCHNKEAFSQVIDEINNIFHNKVYFILGGIEEKNWNKIAEIMPKSYKYIITEPSIERAIPSDQLASIFKKNKLNYIIKPDLNEAISYCKASCNSNELIFIGGSLFLISDYNEK
mgnify:CR=1 FL=1